MIWPWSKCQPIIKYDGIDLSFSGLEVPNEFINFKVGNFQIKKETLQTATEIAQMFDLFRVSNCEKIQQFPKDSPEKIAFMLETAKNEQRLLEFLAMVKIAANRPSPKIEQAMEDWIALSFTKRIEEEAPMIPNKMRGDSVVRESPPIKEFNSIKRSVANAKATSQHLQQALRAPKFELGQLYEFE